MTDAGPTTSAENAAGSATGVGLTALAAAASQNILLAGLATSIAAALTNRRLRRTEEFLRDLVGRVDELSAELDEHIDIAYLSSDDFVAIIEVCLNGLMNEASREKLRFVVDFAAACAMLKADAEIAEIYAGILLSLRGVHIGILSFIYETQKMIPESDLIGSVGRRGLPLKESDIVSRSPILNADLLRLILVDLERLRLVRFWDGSGAPDSGIALTAIGGRFMRFAKLETVRTATWRQTPSGTPSSSHH